ncbi:DUF6509 family protein [Cohnella faecalis]|uniref:Pullulanase n=1 Tax=Cohnella faecalis TaxID=2315694 RepID=A0A398CSA2_9BACL|nr:DUF6509 family protein [Cohnella faecalis]RIE01824.1 pullulanase [Cohnella faecalis]
MFTVTKHSVEAAKDPFGILVGKRYEFKLDLEVDEEDELYSENGIYARVVFKVDEDKTSIVTCNFIEKSTDRVLDFDPEADEEETLAAYCKENLPES